MPNYIVVSAGLFGVRGFVEVLRRTRNESAEWDFCGCVYGMGWVWGRCVDNGCPRKGDFEDGYGLNSESHPWKGAFLRMMAAK